MADTKICTKCKQKKPLDHFYANKNMKLGKQSRCKICCSTLISKRVRERRLTDPIFRTKLIAQERIRAKKKWAKNCKNEEWMRKTRLKRFRSRFKTKYGITLEDKEIMVQSQDNKCMICKKTFTSLKNTHLDHDHKTGNLRDILCSDCNRGLGCFRDNSEILQEACKYLLKWRIL